MIPALIFLYGCRGGGGGIGGESSVLSIDQNIMRGWDHISSGNYSEAISSFELALKYATDAKQQTEARTGLGWAYAKRGEIDTAITHLEKVKNLNNDANVGLAGCYLARGNEKDYQNVISLIKHIDEYGGGIDHYNSAYTGVSNAELHAILAYCYYVINDTENSKKEIERAKELDPNNDSVKDIESALNALGLTLSKL